MSEKRHYSEMLGPTQKCLMVEQFKRFKHGDRFWYERDDPVTGFTLGNAILFLLLLFKMDQNYVFMIISCFFLQTFDILFHL